MTTKDRPISFYRSGDGLRSRTIGSAVVCGKIVLPSPPPKIIADWQRDVESQLGLEIGDVEPLPLARTRARWPALNQCIAAASLWTQTAGLSSNLLFASDMALMACRAARYHHDGLQYGGHAFCNLFLSEDKGLDLHFPALGQRIPLGRGTVVVFDTCQPHAVIKRNRSNFQATDFAADEDCTQVFLTWELAIEDERVAKALGVSFDVAGS